jgi:hypothetical protein
VLSALALWAENTRLAAARAKMVILVRIRRLVAYRDEPKISHPFNAKVELIQLYIPLPIKVIQVIPRKDLGR